MPVSVTEGEWLGEVNSTTPLSDAIWEFILTPASSNAIQPTPTMLPRILALNLSTVFSQGLRAARNYEGGKSRYWDESKSPAAPKTPVTPPCLVPITAPRGQQFLWAGDEKILGAVKITLLG